MEKKKKGLIAIIIIVAVIVVAGILAYIFIFNKPVPYVEENNIEIASMSETYSIPVYPYTTNTNGDVIDVKSVFNECIATYKFYDYSVTEPDENGMVEVSFKYDIVAPLKYTRTDYSYTDKYYYTYFYSNASLFDYYTGQIYLKNNYNTNSSEENNKEMKYTDIVFGRKTTKVGVRTETTSKWDGKQNPEKDVYTDTSRLTIAYYISIPEKYDGLMIAIPKNGPSKKSFENKTNFNKKLNELKEQANKTGEKSEELVQMEEKSDAIYTILNPHSYENLIFTPSDLYVFRISDIKPAK